MTFELQIVTPDGLAFEGQAEKLDLRTVEGVIGILPRHIDYVAPVGMGEAVVTTPEGKRRAACIGVMIEWAEEIDVERAKEAETRARNLLAKPDLSERDLKIAEARLHRALVRQAVGSGK